MLRFLQLRGLQDYEAVRALQQEMIAARLAGEIPDAVLLLEHSPVITVGRRPGAEANVLDAGPVPVVEVERGGDVTWHGPGQLVAYPIVALQRHDLHTYMRALEEAVIGVLAELGVQAGRDPRNTGVWVKGLKVCSIGIAARRWVTWHGLALNVDADLEGFSRIVPCGLGPDVMTRLADHVGVCPTVEEVGARLAPHLARALGLEWGGLAAIPAAEMSWVRAAAY